VTVNPGIFRTIQHYNYIGHSIVLLFCMLLYNVGVVW